MMKCVRLTSVGLATSDQDPNTGDFYNCEHVIMVGVPFDGPIYNYSTNEYIHNDRDVMSIEISEYFPNGLCPREYKVTLKSGNILYVPGDKFIAEYAKEASDEK